VTLKQSVATISDSSGWDKEFIFDDLNSTKKAVSQVDPLYQAEDCTDCPVANLCKNKEGNRKIALNHVLHEEQDQTKANLAYPQGIEVRVNRSIQSESIF